MADDANGSRTVSPHCGHTRDASPEPWAEHVAVACARHGGMIIRDARGYLGNQQDAEDVTQDLWVHLLEHPNGKALTAPYLRTCAKYRCWRFRAERSKAHHEETRIADFLRIFVHTDVQANERFDKLVHWLLSAIRKLPRAERKVVRRSLEGLSLEEIAGRQGARRRSVRRTWLRAIDRLGGLADDGEIPMWASRARDRSPKLRQAMRLRKRRCRKIRGFPLIWGRKAATPLLRLPTYSAAGAGSGSEQDLQYWRKPSVRCFIHDMRPDPFKPMEV